MFIYFVIQEEKTSDPQGKKIDCVPCYKYLGVLLDDCLKHHVENFVKKLSSGFYCSRCFSTEGRKKLVATIFLPVLDCGDLYTVHECTRTMSPYDGFCLSQHIKMCYKL